MEVQLIKGGIHADNRGVLCFCNDFDFKNIKRFYQITQNSIEIIRGWQGHKKESKWFYCNAGSFLINYVKPENWINPTGDEQVEVQLITASNPCIMYLPPNFATAIKANEPNSILTIYSNFTVQESINDDFRFNLNTWNVNTIA